MHEHNVSGVLLPFKRVVVCSNRLEESNTWKNSPQVCSQPEHDRLGAGIVSHFLHEFGLLISSGPSFLSHCSVYDNTQQQLGNMPSHRCGVGSLDLGQKPSFFGCECAMAWKDESVCIAGHMLPLPYSLESGSTCTCLHRTVNMCLDQFFS